MSLAQLGDRDAMETLLRDHYDLMFRVCRGICSSTTDAEDATQNACIKVARSISKFERNASLTTWIYRIATNSALDTVRSSRRHLVAFADDAQDDIADPSLSNEDNVVLRSDVNAALSELSEEFRVAVVLRDVVDLDYGDIADILQVPIGTVRSRIARGRVAFAKSYSGNQTSTGERLTKHGEDTDG